MSLLLWFVLQSSSFVYVYPHYTISSPILDGELDSVGVKSSERTIAYLVYDEKNIYVFLKCYSSSPVNREIGFRDDAAGDNVGVIIDPLVSNENAYLFKVNAEGVQEDGVLLLDGRKYDKRWDGVWVRSIKITDEGYNAEISIPFRTLRFSIKDSIWNINFLREISSKEEAISWAPFLKEERIRVSKSGKLVGIKPIKGSFGIEVFPVASVKLEEDKFDFLKGIDLSWRVSSTCNFNTTFYPDFAQIEADPYTVNLSKYEVYLQEKRDFFTSNTEYFRTNEQTITPFYSRRIGKRMQDGTEIPIIAGGSLTKDYKKLKIGLLGAITECKEYTKWDNSLLYEPQSNYGVSRIKANIFKNCWLGNFLVGKQNDSITNYVVGIDYTLRMNQTQITGLVARSELNQETGYGGVMTFSWIGKKISLDGQYLNQSKDFEISHIGYAPYKGIESFKIGVNTQSYNLFIFREFYYGVNLSRKKEFQEPKDSRDITLMLNPIFNNLWGMCINIGVNNDYEIDRSYNNTYYWIGIWNSPYQSFSANLNISYNSQEYNYRRDYFGANSMLSVYISQKIRNYLNIGVDITNVIEWNPMGRQDYSSWTAYPTLHYAIYKDLYLRIYAQPNTDTHIHQFNILLSWNFKPKSFLYVGVNEARDNLEGKFSLNERILLLKANYLFIF
ncbi:MAG: hypothetical protein HY769_05300 [Candidatus Stahlbacteria bacterium]|nr:hypothetical protein [Candidatus Stahlbacteria bacterium]